MGHNIMVFVVYKIFNEKYPDCGKSESDNLIDQIA